MYETITVTTRTPNFPQMWRSISAPRNLECGRTLKFVPWSRRGQEQCNHLASSLPRTFLPRSWTSPVLVPRQIVRLMVGQWVRLSCPRIDQLHPASLKIIRVSRGQDCSVGSRDGRDLRIERRHRSPLAAACGGDQRECMSGFVVKGQNVTREDREGSFSPCSQYIPAFTRGKQFDPQENLCYGDRSNVGVFSTQSSKPVENQRLRAWTHHFRNDIRVKNGHRRSVDARAGLLPVLQPIGIAHRFPWQWF